MQPRVQIPWGTDPLQAYILLFRRNQPAESAVSLMEMHHYYRPTVLRVQRAFVSGNLFLRQAKWAALSHAGSCKNTSHPHWLPGQPETLRCQRLRRWEAHSFLVMASLELVAEKGVVLVVASPSLCPRKGKRNLLNHRYTPPPAQDRKDQIITQRNRCHLRVKLLCCSTSAQAPSKSAGRQLHSQQQTSSNQNR